MKLGTLGSPKENDEVNKETVRGQRRNSDEDI